MNRSSNIRRSLLVSVGALIIGMAPQVMQAQKCPGSSLGYIVRDAKGAPIESTHPDLQYGRDSGSKFRQWKVYGAGFHKTQGLQVPAGVATLTNKTSTLGISEYCNFTSPITLQLTFKGKTMNLTFIVPKAAEYKSEYEPANFLVDSIPFKAGKFEITLLLPKARSNYETVYSYSARDWKKVAE